MDLSSHTHWADNQPPLPLPSRAEGRLYLVPRHLDEDSARYAMEWDEYRREHEDTIRRGGPAALPADAELARRWDDYVASVTPTFTSRADAVAFLAALTDAVNATWPQPR